jgi:hypothetical protein
MYTETALSGGVAARGPGGALKGIRVVLCQIELPRTVA